MTIYLKTARQMTLKMLTIRFQFLLFMILMLATFFGVPLFAQKADFLIPMPQHIRQLSGKFHMSSKTKLLSSSGLIQLESFLSRELLSQSNITLSSSNLPSNESIKLVLRKNLKNNERYQLNIRPKQIEIVASSRQGIFYGIISLLQLVQAGKTTNGTSVIPCLTINDQPSYSWRGFMLDESRAFFGKEKVKQILNWMAYYKLNRFHWHLTDEPGWRLEIKKYPKLTQIGGIGNYLNPNASAAFYTQDDIEEIVAFAAERFITIIPEIDMPGHATAANRAYPEFSGGGSKAHPDFTFNPGKAETYSFLSNILRETNSLFPSRMIHLGGDEVSYGNEKWKKDTSITELKRRENLNDDKAVELYFMKRMADSVYKMGSKVLVWDEMAEAKLPNSETIIFWWRHDKPELIQKALANGYPTVLCPRLPLYFDFVQDSMHRVGRKWVKLYNPIDSVYQFDARSYAKSAPQEQLILGIQANLWTETAPNQQRLDYLMFPRIAALAEAAWTNSTQKDLIDFKERLKMHLPIYETQGIYFYNPFNPLKNTEPKSERKFPLNYID